MAETPNLGLTYLEVGQENKELVVNGDLDILDGLVVGTTVNYAADFTSQTTVTISGATHGLGTPDLLVVVKDDSTPRQVLPLVSITIDDATYDVVLTFAVAQSGRVVLKAL